MTGFSSGKGFSGNQLYIAIAIWLALVLAGGACLYIGYNMSSGDDGSKQAAVTPTNVVIPTATSAEGGAATVVVATSTTVTELENTFALSA